MDARYEKVRVGCRIVSEGLLVVSAIREDGFREILAVEVADVESEATYQELSRTLKERGLKGVELVTPDEHKGLKSAIERPLPQGASHQRCQFHYAKNLLGLAFRSPRATVGESVPPMVWRGSTRRLKRRSRVVRIFPNREACLRLLTALAVGQSEEWLTGRRYLDIEELKQEELKQERSRERAGAEVVFTER